MKKMTVLFLISALYFSGNAFADEMSSCNFRVQVHWSNEVATSYSPVGNCDDLPGSTNLECRNEARRKGYNCFQMTSVVYATGFAANSCWGCFK